MSQYVDVAIPYWQLRPKEVEIVDERISNGDWNWEEELRREDLFWQASFRNFHRRPAGHDKQGVDKLAEIVLDEVEHKPMIPTDLQIFTLGSHGLADRPEVKENRYAWRVD